MQDEAMVLSSSHKMGMQCNAYRDYIVCSRGKNFNRQEASSASFSKNKYGVLLSGSDFSPVTSYLL